jgi:hypothetical protein
MVKQGVTKIMENVMPFGEVLEAVDKLPLEEQETLIAVLHHRSLSVGEKSWPKTCSMLSRNLKLVSVGQ